jgi:hypothetical protein
VRRVGRAESGFALEALAVAFVAFEAAEFGLAGFALEAGFPEIQLDYVRFPSEGKQSTMVFPSRTKYPNAEASPSQGVAEFVRSLRPIAASCGTLLAGDIFGMVSSGGGDRGIGQELQTIAEPFDVICPLVYPSYFAKGEYGIRDPNGSRHRRTEASRLR